MIKHGNPPYLECSSKGDKRFSAFYAKVKSKGNKSIEELYQGFKKFEDGSTGLSIKEAKGKKAINQEEASKYYTLLWKAYMLENPELIEVISSTSGLSDIFGQEGHCCQATELWNIRNSYIRKIKPLRVIITGSKTFGYPMDKECINKTQQEIRLLTEQCHREAINSISHAVNQTCWNIETVISGVTRGADFIGEQWALRNMKQIEQYPAEFSAYGNNASFIRNQKMIDNADALLAFWDGESKGTKHMIDLATVKGLLVFIVKI